MNRGLELNTKMSAKKGDIEIHTVAEIGKPQRLA
jgi:hypothetical protein